MSYTPNGNLSDNLEELVLSCNRNGQILYANPAVLQYSRQPLVGKPFTDLLLPEVVDKALLFFQTACAASPQKPTPQWELTLGSDTDYVIATFRGYHDHDTGVVVLIGTVEDAEVGALQQELLDLTSELTDTQRQLQRQNRALQHALAEQQQLLETIQALSAPIAPITDGVLLLPLVGHIDSPRAARIHEELLNRVSACHTHTVILDITSIATIDTAVARHLIDTARAVRLLGARAVLVGVNPAIAETIVHLGINLREFMIYSDLQHAIAAVLSHQNRRFV